MSVLDIFRTKQQKRNIKLYKILKNLDCTVCTKDCNNLCYELVRQIKGRNEELDNLDRLQALQSVEIDPDSVASDLPKPKKARKPKPDIKPSEPVKNEFPAPQKTAKKVKPNDKQA